VFTDYVVRESGGPFLAIAHITIKLFMGFIASLDFAISCVSLTLALPTSDDVTGPTFPRTAVGSAIFAVQNLLFWSWHKLISHG
jgi:hypothetical protein